MRFRPVIWNVTMAPTMMATNNIWNSATHQCHGTGLRRRKSTLQNVTKRMQNMNSGSMASNTGAKNRAAEASCGV